MPYSNLLMVVILCLQLLSLYLIIFLHKQLLAIGLVVGSLILSAALVMLSRKSNKSQQDNMYLSDEFFDLLTSLFNHINQRHYQIHNDFQKFAKTLMANEKNQHKHLDEIRRLALSQKDIVKDGQDSIDELKTVNLKNIKTQHSKLTETDSQKRNNITQQLAEEAIHLKSITDNVANLKLRLTDSSRLVDEIRLMALNASIEAARAGESATGFARVAEQISRTAKRAENHNGELQVEVESITKDLNSCRNSMDTPESKTTDTIELGEFNQSISETSNKLDDVENTIKQIQMNLNESEYVLHNNLVDELEAIFQSEEINELDTALKTIKEYFVECMIHLDELKQGLLTPEDFQQNLVKMNQMIAELYDTEDRIQLTNEVLK